MARGRVGQLEVEVTADLDKLDKGLRDAEGKVRKAGDKMEEAGQKVSVFAGATDKLAAGLAILGTVETVMKSLTAVVAGMRGDSEAMVKALTTLPLGLGPAVQSSADLWAQLTGAAQEAERLNRILDVQAEMLRRSSDMLERRQQGREAIADINRKYTDQIQLAMAVNDEQRAQLQAEIDRRDAIERINKLLEKQGLTLDSNEGRRARSLATHAAQIELEEQQAVLAERRRQAEMSAQQQEMMRQQAAQASGLEVLSIISQIRATELATQGRTFDAQRERLTSAFEQRASTSDPENVEILRQLLDAQLKQVDVAEAEAQKRDMQSASSGGDSLARAFATTGFQQVSASRFGTASTTGPVELTEDKKQTQILTRIERNTGRNNTAVLAP